MLCVYSGVIRNDRRNKEIYHRKENKPIMAVTQCLKGTERLRGLVEIVSNPPGNEK